MTYTYFDLYKYIVNVKTSSYDIYIGRPTKWSNPFYFEDDFQRKTLGKYLVSSRKEAIDKYEESILSNSSLIEEIKLELKGKILGCHCAPALCHGLILARIANF